MTLQGNAVVAVVWDTGREADGSGVIANITAGLMVPGLFPQTKTFQARIPAPLRELVIPGRSLPVTVGERHPHDVEVDWIAFEREFGQRGQPAEERPTAGPAGPPTPPLTPGMPSVPPVGMPSVPPPPPSPPPRPPEDS